MDKIGARVHTSCGVVNDGVNNWLILFSLKVFSIKIRSSEFIV